jgi:hypothetical protein
MILTASLNKQLKKERTVLSGKIFDQPWDEDKNKEMLQISVFA